jgi:two-component system osmolarity sensor histidine kinase EnvZ
MRRLWPDSLFTRMLLVQAMLVVSGLLIFTISINIERNALVVRPYTALAVPGIRQLAALPVGAPPVHTMGLSGGMRRESGPPAGTHLRGFLAPFRAMRDEFARHGITLETLWFTGWTDDGIVVRAALRIDGGELVWISFHGYQGFSLPGWGPLTNGGLLALLVMAAVATRMFSRRVTRPLARLHDRMLRSVDAGGTLAPLAADDPWPPPPELQAMERAYSDLADKLARNERERALLLAGVSHDLRSPLARIRLAAEMLPDRADTADGVAAVTRNVDVADRLIASFLEFVRAGTLTLEETVDAAAVVRQAVAGFGRPPQALQALAPKRLLLHGASSLLLERMVVNLVDNALKHGALPVQVRVASVGDDMQLTVVDAGPGLPAAGAERLMEAFARGDASRHVPGFGLGLAIIVQIVTRLQGRLHFERGPHGHAVQVVLPLRR